jgi:hypothetical protein
MSTAMILAAECKFIDCIPDPMGGVFVNGLRIVGVVVLVTGLLKAVSTIAKGQFPMAVRQLLLTFVLVGLLFFPDTIYNIISAISGLVGKVVESVPNVGGSGTSGTPGAPVTTP